MPFCSLCCQCPSMAGYFQAPTDWAQALVRREFCHRSAVCIVRPISSSEHGPCLVAQLPFVGGSALLNLGQHPRTAWRLMHLIKNRRWSRSVP